MIKQPEALEAQLRNMSVDELLSLKKFLSKPSLKRYEDAIQMINQVILDKEQG